MTGKFRGDRELSGVARKHLLPSVSHISLVVTLSKYSHFTNESSMVLGWDIGKCSPGMFGQVHSMVLPIILGKKKLTTSQGWKTQARGTGSHELVVGGLWWGGSSTCASPGGFLGSVEVVGLTLSSVQSLWGATVSCEHIHGFLMHIEHKGPIAILNSLTRAL